MAGIIEMPAHVPDHKSVELYLRERGLSAFKDRLFEYGVETVADLLDQEIVYRRCSCERHFHDSKGYRGVTRATSSWSGAGLLALEYESSKLESRRAQNGWRF